MTVLVITGISLHLLVISHWEKTVFLVKRNTGETTAALSRRVLSLQLHLDACSGAAASGTAAVCAVSEEVTQHRVPHGSIELHDMACSEVFYFKHGSMLGASTENGTFDDDRPDLQTGAACSKIGTWGLYLQKVSTGFQGE
jgi:hypothetical protein